MDVWCLALEQQAVHCRLRAVWRQGDAKAKLESWREALAVGFVIVGCVSTQLTWEMVSQDDEARREHILV